MGFACYYIQLTYEEKLQLIQYFRKMSLRLVATRRFNFLPHAISILNRKISNQNARHCGAFLPWLLKSTLVWPSWL
jgi:hypothetical protein